MLTAREDLICRAVEARAAFLLEDLRRHVALPTGLGNAAALDASRGILTDRLKALGATVSLVPGDPKEPWLPGAEFSSTPPPTAVCDRFRQGAALHVLLSGHLDTVHDPEGPFRSLEVSPDGRTATGPGCVDMKGGLVIAVAALEALEECGVPVSYRFILNSDEETGSYHSESALRNAVKGCGVGLVFEPALPDGSLVLERPGSGQFMIETFGKSAHVGRDFTSGVSAVTALAHALVRVSEMPEPVRGQVISVGPLKGGPATNVVPDHAAAWGNVRFTTPAARDELAAKLESIETVKAGQLPRVVVRRSFNRPPKPLTPQVQTLALAAKTAAEDLGQNLPFGVTGGVCDGNILQDAGLPTIDTLGVRGGGLHTPQEWIELASLVERCQLVAILLARLAERGLQPAV